ncbi:MAG: tetratricopeptide repeat protein [Microthrixaceae bacterium]|nr:tetratricopeptide repeat protein [Microthrixaceae bacterium]
MVDVTDATFGTEVLERSQSQPVVVDLWAPWCGPCQQLGPLLEEAVGATGGQVVLAKVNVDDNPQVAQAFRVQGIPAVFGLKGGQVVDSFVGAQGRDAVTAFVQGLLPTDEENELTALVAAGDEPSLRKALELDPGHEPAVLALAELLVSEEEAPGDDRAEEALALLARIPETPETRRIAALARTGAPTGDDVTATLDALLDRVKHDDEARQEYVDLLDVMGADDPRTAEYRKRLTAQLY